MKTTILNRDFQHPSDGWYHIEALGEHPNRQAAVMQVIDEEACSSIVRAFNSAAEAGTLRHGSEMLIDREHFKDNPDKDTTAYGWLQQLQNRADGIYGRIRWTATGKAAVDGGDYRFFSTEYDPESLKVVNTVPIASGKFRRVRPLQLDGLTLTNMNNNRGQKPITNRDSSPYMNPDGSFKGGFDGCVLHMTNIEGHSEDSAKRICGYIAANVANKEFRSAPRGASAGSENNNQRTKMKTVATKLGLSADASEEAVLAEVTKVMNRAETAEKELTPIKNRVTELEAGNKSLLEEQVSGILAEHGVKDEKLINRLKPLLAALKNREERVACLADLGIKAEIRGQRAEGKPGRVINRADAKTPGNGSGATAPEGDDAERATADKIRNRANELRRAEPKRAWDSCWAEASQELAAKN